MDAAARGGGLYRHLGTGRTYARLGEAFAHPDGAREGRLDVVLGEVSAEAAPASTGAAPAGRLVTVPFAELHGSGAAAPVLERLEPGGGGHGVGGGAEAVLGVGAPRYYRHFKGKLYQELGRAQSLSGGGEEVVYRTLYPSSYALFTRPKSNFEGEAGEKAPGKRRFEEVSPEELGADAAARAQRPCLAPPPAGPAACSSSVALVTGASAGLGREAAVQLAAAGFLVFAAARSAERLAEELMKEADAAGRPPPRIVALTLDVRSQDSVQRAFHEVQERAGRLDVLVNNAGVLVVGTVEMVSMSQAEDLFQTNLFGAMRCMHEALPMMREQKSGCIVNVSTILAEIPTMNQPVYAASKAALDALTLGTREAVRPFGISVHSLQPGGIVDTAIGTNLSNGNRFEPDANPYPIDALVKESVFDRIIPKGQKSAEVAKIVVDMALGKVDVAVMQTSEFTEELARAKLKDTTGNSIVALRY